ncbi:hypothetical protein [Vibrio cyclitrophicus]|nr:hypothetical protein [Vibrio cyclitrophicus]
MKVARTVLRGATLGNKCRLLDNCKLQSWQDDLYALVVINPAEM